jgi:signal transduction histidine kinase
VLLNLLSNAVKYNRDDGKVWISFDEQNDLMGVSIRDEGCGVRRDELPRIFDKFYRAAGSGQVKGAGLGLYIVKLLMEAMGGKITAKSDKDAGSTFIASFAKADAAAIRPDAQDKEILSANFQILNNVKIKPDGRR